MRKLGQIKDKNKLLLNLLLIAILLVFLAPVMNAILHSLPASDDFGMASYADKEHLLLSSLDTAYYFYMNWAGGWIGAFLEVFLNPIVLFGITSPMFGVEMLVFFLLFVVALVGASYSFTKRVLNGKSLTVALLMTFVFLFWMLNIDVWTEIFHWFVGSSYLWGVSLTLCMLHLEMKFFETGAKKDAIKLSVIGFITCTFYTTAVVPCFVYLIYAVMLLVRKDAQNKLKKLIPFGVSLLGAAMAILAPGNFARKDVAGGGLDIWSAFDNTAIVWKELMMELVKSQLFVVVMLAFVLIGIKCFPKEKLVLGNPIIPFVLSALCIYINYFPLALGYGSSWYVPNRAKFIFCIFTVMLFSLSAIYLGGWIAAKLPDFVPMKTVGEVLRATAFVLVFTYLCYVPSHSYGNLAWMRIVSQTDEMVALNARCIDLLNDIIESPEADYVYQGPYIGSVIIKQPGFYDIYNGGVNGDLVRYLGKDSITVIWQIQ